jgi:hypothetical protein
MQYRWMAFAKLNRDSSPTFWETSDVSAHDIS